VEGRELGDSRDGKSMKVGAKNVACFCQGKGKREKGREEGQSVNSGGGRARECRSKSDVDHFKRRKEKKYRLVKGPTEHSKRNNGTAISLGVEKLWVSLIFIEEKEGKGAAGTGRKMGKDRC